MRLISLGSGVENESNTALTRPPICAILQNKMRRPATPLIAASMGNILVCYGEVDARIVVQEGNNVSHVVDPPEGDPAVAMYIDLDPANA